MESHFNSYNFFKKDFNRRNSFLSFGRPLLYNSEALPFTYDQYVVKKLAEKLYNSVTLYFLSKSMNFHPDKQLFFKLLALGLEPLTLGLQSQTSTSTPWGTHFQFLLI